MGKMSRNPRYNVLSFRATDEEYKAILQAAKSAGKARGNLVRELVMGGLRSGSGGNDANESR